jgi:hypothetical protein
MNPLHYTSEEMFSSTELIRKGKNIFDKLQRQKIDKAIILRDGKPSFMLLDFKQYEEIMTEYMSLKQMLNGKTIERHVEKKVEKEVPIKVQKKEVVSEEIEDTDLENALAEIENLDLNAVKEDDKEEKLKDFWE